MDDDRLDETLQATARDYHAPPPTPRETMWQAISARRRADRVRRTAPKPWIPWAAAAAALLAVGAALGRVSAPVAPSPEAAPAPAATPRVNRTAYHLVALEHLGQSEAFLTMFRASLRSGGRERLAPAAARQLLATNRLLLDSPAAQDRRTRLLLEDLELVLAEIAQLPVEPSREAWELVGEGMERGSVLPRLRMVVPAGMTPTRGGL